MSNSEVGDKRFSRRTILQIGGVGLGLGAIAALGGRDYAAAAERKGPKKLKFSVNGNVKYKVYAGANEDAVVIGAAHELGDVLEEICGEAVDVIVSNTAPSGPRIIVVGANNPMASSFDPIDYSALGDDGFATRLDNKRILISGASSRGTLYGVYWLLNELCGVRWYAPDVSVVPSDPSLEFDSSRFGGEHVPRFRYREIYTGDGYDPAYRHHNRLNGSTERNSTVPTIPARLNTWSPYWPTASTGDSFHQLVPDQSKWAGGQLACMDQGVRDMAVTNLAGVLQTRVAAGLDPAYGFCQADTVSWDADPASLAFAASHGGNLSAPIIDMVNEVATRVAAQVPGARTSTQAYQFSFEPPTGMTVASNVVMTLAPINADFGEPLFSGSNTATGASMAAWCGISEHVVLWDYVTNFSSFIAPYPTWWAAGDGLKELAQLPSAQGYFGLGAYTTSGGEFAYLRTWVLSQLLWDPSLDTDDLIQEFLTAYYGAAAPKLYDYMELLRDAATETGVRVGYKDGVGAQYLGFDTMRAADTLLAQAAVAVAGNSVLAQRIDRERMGVDYIILTRTPQFRAEADTRNITWDPDWNMRIARLEAAMTAAGLQSIGESGTAPSELIQRLALNAIVASPPALIQSNPALEWQDFQEPAMVLYAVMAETVPDAAASNGYAVEMPGNDPNWGVQVPMDSLPAGSDWEIYVSVRVDAGTAAPGDVAIEAGVWTGPSTRTYPTIADIGDGDYHEIRIPGVHQYTSGGLIYVAPPANPAVTSVWVDRVFAVKV